MSKILIIEDELLIAESLGLMLESLGHEVVYYAMCFNTAKNYIQRHKFDLAFVDINLDGNNEGIDLGKLLHDKSISFMYLTSYYDKDTLELAKHTYPDSYLIKPITKKELFANLQIVLAKNSQNRIKLKNGRDSVFVKLEDVLWVKSDRNYLEIQTKDKKYIERTSFHDFLEGINTDIFCRTHRSWLVNVNKISKVFSDKVLIEDFEIPISRSFKGELKCKLL